MGLGIFKVVLPKKLTKECAQDWLRKNRPDIQLVEWGGSGSLISKFICNDRPFQAKFNYVKAHPDRSFGLTKQEQIDLCLKKTKERWGIDNPFQSEEIKEKIRQTNLKRYGVENPQQNKQIRQKTKETNLKRYGVEHPQQNTELKNKRIQTNLERYGGTYPQFSSDVKEKTKQTNLKKHGSEYVFQSEEIRQKIRQTIKEKYGVEYLHQNEAIKEKAWKTRVQKGQITIVNGKSLFQWSKDPTNAGHTAIYRAHRMGIHPQDTEPYRSSLELKIKQFLLKIRFREKQTLKQCGPTDFLHDKKLPDLLSKPNKGSKRPDFCFPLLKFIIECDGEHYHLRTEEQIKKDKERNQLYIDFGYDVVIFLGKQIDKEFESISSFLLEKIQRKVENFLK